MAFSFVKSSEILLKTGVCKVFSENLAFNSFLELAKSSLKQLQ